MNCTFTETLVYRTTRLRYSTSTEPHFYWTSFLLNHSSTEPNDHWTTCLLNHTSTEPHFYWTTRLLNLTSTEPHFYWTTRLLNLTSTEPHVYWTSLLLNLTSTEPPISHGRSSASQPHILTQDELNDPVRNLELSKSKADLLGSRLNNGIFSRKMSEFLLFSVVISSLCLLHKGICPCLLLRCGWPGECPRNRTWPATMATIYILFETVPEGGVAV